MYFFKTQSSKLNNNHGKVNINPITGLNHINGHHPAPATALHLLATKLTSQLCICDSPVLLKNLIVTIGTDYLSWRGFC